MILLDNPVQDKIVEDGINWFKNSSEQVFEIDGEAGTGKSVTLWRIINGLGLQPYEILPMAYTGQASIVMRTKGFLTARSIHSSLYHIVRKPLEYKVGDDPFHIFDLGLNKERYTFEFQPLARGELPRSIRLMVVDEGWMVPKKMVHDMKKHGIRILVAGDSGQLPPIGDEPGFLTSNRVHHLTQIMRQSANNPIIYLAHRARRGEPIHCGVYGNNAIVIEDKDLTNEMVLNVGNIICATNKTRDSVNTNVRSLLNLPNHPVFGDRVICKNNNWDMVMGDIALTNGLTGIISSPVSVDNFKYKDKNLFNMDFKPDLLNQSFMNLKVNYEYIMSDYAERNKIKNNRFANKRESGELFEYAYALTTHSAQGSEYPAGILIEEYLRPEVQAQLIYTGITRFKHNLIYVKRTKKYY